MSLNINNLWGRGPSTPNNNNPPATTGTAGGNTYTTFSSSTGVNPNISGGGGGNWQVGNIGMAGVVGSSGTDYVGTIKCDRCGYKETLYEEKYCKLCNEEL